MSWEHIIAAAGTLFLVLDPAGTAPMVQSLLLQLPEKRRKHVLLRELFFVLILLLFFFFLGKVILGWMGISTSSLNLSGGIMLFIIAIGMVFPTKRSPHMNLSSTEIFIVPVTVPLIVGPAAISVVMMQAAMCTTPPEKLEGIISILLAWFITAALLCLSGKILTLLGEKGTTALTRLMGTILVLLSVQMILNGITEYIKTLPNLLPTP